jgi:hypothetical protein
MMLLAGVTDVKTSALTTGQTPRRRHLALLGHFPRLVKPFSVQSDLFAHICTVLSEHGYLARF